VELRRAAMQPVRRRLERNANENHSGQIEL
jgi:hypothetical protein